MKRKTKVEIGVVIIALPMILILIQRLLDGRYLLVFLALGLAYTVITAIEWHARNQL